MTPNIHYTDREIEGERLELLKGSLYWLGPNLTLRDCTVVISVASRGLTLMSGQFIGCTLQAKSELSTLRWARMSLKGCRFKGRFTGNDFGFREDDLDKWRLGGMVDCDFSEARLHGCRFFNCDMSTVRLPRWPCFHLHGSSRTRGGAGPPGVAWPLRSGRVKGLAEEPEGVVAVTWHAPTIAEKLDTTAEDLRPVLERLPWVVT